MAFVFKRNFAALKANTKTEKQKLNKSIITSDYKPNYPYAVIDLQEHFEIPFKNRREAEYFAEN